MAQYPNRPRPLQTVADKVTRVVGVAGSLATALVGWGVMTVQQGDATTGLLGAIPGVVTAVTSVLVAFGVVRGGEPLVTPTEDPRDDAMNQLR